jgi:hypothetical protein
MRKSDGRKGSFNKMGFTAAEHKMGRDDLRSLEKIKQNLYIFYVYNLYLQHHKYFRHDCEYLLSFALFLYGCCENTSSVLTLLSAASFLFPTIFQKYTIFYLRCRVEEKRRALQEEEKQRDEDVEEMKIPLRRTSTEESLDGVDELMSVCSSTGEMQVGLKNFLINKNSSRNLLAEANEDGNEFGSENDSDDEVDFKVDKVIEGCEVSVKTAWAQYQKVLSLFLAMLHHLNKNSYNVHTFVFFMCGCICYVRNNAIFLLNEIT